MKKINFLLMGCILVSPGIFAQWVTTDVIQQGQNATMIGQQATMIDQAISNFKKMKEMYDQAQKSHQEFVQIKEYLETAEERLQRVGDIKDLRLNKIQAIMDRTLCIKQGNYFPKSIRFYDMVNNIRNAFYSCDNQAIYNKTYSGVLESLDARVYMAGSVAHKDVVQRLNEFNIVVKEAEVTKEVTNGYDTRMKLELGLKYKAISDELMKLSDELHAAINLDNGNGKNIALTPAERLQMMDMANKYQIQSLEYEEKSARLLKEASTMNQDQAEKLAHYKRDLAVKQMINFKL